MAVWYLVENFIINYFNIPLSWTEQKITYRISIFCANAYRVVFSYTFKASKVLNIFDINTFPANFATSLSPDGTLSGHLTLLRL